MSEKGSRDSSFSRVFSYSVLAFFFLQVVCGVFVIVFFIGGEMYRMQTSHVKTELEGRTQHLISFLDDRLMILNDYSRLPAIVAGVMDPEGQQRNTVNLMDSLPFLKSEALFSLQDFQGDYIYSQWFFEDAGPVDDFNDLLQGRVDKDVEVLGPFEGTPSCCYWRLSVPVEYQGIRKGVLSAYFPIDLNDNFPEAEDDVRIVLRADGRQILSVGEVPEPTMTIESEIGFSDIILQQSVSRKKVNERVTYLIIAMVSALIAGTVLVVIVVQRLGKKLFLVPHKKLQAMRDELEQEVEKRTNDLKMRTDQLSIEIKERREAEIEARENGKLISSLLEGISAAFFIINPVDNTIVRSNSVVYEMFGLTPWQVSNQACAKLFLEFSDSMADLLCPESIGKGKYIEGVARHAEGNTFPVARYLVPMEVQGKEHIGVIILNITERKNLERRLNVAQKLESVGELASGIAHEINTPVQYVGDSIRFVREAVADILEIMEAENEIIEKCRAAGLHKDLIENIEELEDDADLDFVVEEIPKACSRALEGTERVASIVRAMKNFAHPGTGEMVMVDINQALENTIIVSKNEWKYVAEIVKDFGDVPLVQCFPGDINQVLLNVIVNAAHAIRESVEGTEDKGIITISTLASDGEMIIKIADTGTGIPQEIQDKIFDPFFTTKEVGKGTGQGLAIVHDIVVERHGGRIDIESEVGKGTTFIIGLPLADD